jgi:hypothetical protein
MPKPSWMHVLFVLWYKPLSSIQTSNLPTSPIQGTIHNRHWSIEPFINSNFPAQNNRGSLTKFHEFSFRKQSFQIWYIVNCKKLYTTPKSLQTCVRFISYSKCSNCHRISKLSSKLGYLFTFCYLDGANSIKTDLHICNLWTGQFLSYNSVI